MFTEREKVHDSDFLTTTIQKKEKVNIALFFQDLFFLGRDDGWYVEFVSQFWSQIPLLFTDVDGPDNSVL